MTLSCTISCLNALGGALSFDQLAQNEEALRKGHSYYLTAGTQLMQLIALESLVSKMLPNYKITIPLSLKAIVYLSPIAISVVLFSDLLKGKAQQVGYFIFDHISPLLKGILTVSTIASLFFGYSAASITVLSSLVLFQIAYYFPLIQDYLETGTNLAVPIIDFFNCFSDPSYWMKGFAVIDLIGFFSSYISKDQTLPSLEKPKPEVKSLTLEEATMLLQDPIPLLEVNPIHLQIHVLPNLSDQKVEKLKEIANGINWHLHAKALICRLEKDARYQKRYKERLSPLEAFYQFLDQLIDAMNKKTERELYFTQMLHYIISRLDSLDEIERVDILIRLAVDCGEYCDAAFHETITDIFQSLASTDTQFSLPERLYLLLQNERKRLFQTLIVKNSQVITQNRFFDYLFPMTDIHVQNYLYTIFQKPLGLMEQGANLDQQTEKAWFLHLLNRFLYGRYVQDFNKFYYTPEHIISFIKSRINTSSLPFVDFSRYWSEWIIKQPLTDEEKEILTDEFLEQNSLLGVTIADLQSNNTYMLSDAMICLTLIQLGILKKKE